MVKWRPVENAVQTHKPSVLSRAAPEVQREDTAPEVPSVRVSSPPEVEEEVNASVGHERYVVVWPTYSLRTDHWGIWDHDQHFAVLLKVSDWWDHHFPKEADVASVNFHRSVRRDLEDRTLMSDSDKKDDHSVSLSFEPSDKAKAEVRHGVVPGVPADFKVDLETYNKAYTSKWQDLTEFETAYRHGNPEADEQTVQSAVNDHLFDRMTMLEALMAVHKLEWVMSWRVFDERLKIASEAEKTRIRKKDADHRNVVEGKEPRVRKAREATHVPADPAAKLEMTIKFLMDRFKIDREAALERLRVVAAVKKVNEA